MNNIDSISYFVLLLVLFCAIISTSDAMGAFALLFSFLMLFKLIFSNNSLKYDFEKHDKALLVYFLIVTVSLFASSLFKLSFHGYIKTFIYASFFYSASLFFQYNKSKIKPTILFCICLMSYEAIVAIFQNSSGVNEISGWQDMSNINPEEVVSRAYGTLKPYNPNLLAGYLLCGLTCFIYCILNNLKNNKKTRALIFAILFLINLIAIIDTGCRGAYLGFAFFFPFLFFALVYYAKTQFGGLSKIKNRYKNFIILASAGLIGFVLFNPALIKRFESIFALRADSSISFRFNVYESAFRMFLDNPIFGIGVGNQNFREIYGLYMKSGYDALGSYCVPLEIAVESGIFALLAFIIFLIFVIKKCLSMCLNENNDIEQRIFALCVILMILATMGHGLFDTIWYRPQVQLLFWTFIAMLKSYKKRS